MSALIILESKNDKAVPLPKELAAYAGSTWSRGESRRRGDLHETSGHTLSLGKAEIDEVGLQIEDAIAFFSAHTLSLSAYVQTLEAPQAELVFASCISPAGAAQEITLPAQLVATAGSCGLSISLRTFLTDDTCIRDDE